MDADTEASLPWEAMTHTEGDIPWAALETFAHAVAADWDVLEEILNLYDEFMETPYERQSFECLYVPAILAMAAPKLSDAGRDRAARFLLRSLIYAGDEEDELMRDVLPAAIGAFGPKAVLPVVAEFMPEDYQPGNVAFGLWQMATLARKTRDPQLREPIIRLCTEALEKAEQGRIDIDDVDFAGFVLARIGHQASRPLIQRLYEKTELGDLQDYLDLMDGKWVLPDEEDAWEKPVKSWLEEGWRFLRDWYQDNGKSEELDPERQDQAARSRAEALAKEFGQSLDDLPLPQDAREEAESIAFFLLDYAWTYEGAKPEELTIPVLRELLLEQFPRKISADEEFFGLVGSVVEVFLHWLGKKGILKDVDPLEDAVHEWRDEIRSRGADSRSWGPGKRFMMSAKQHGVDPTDEQAMQRYILEYNRQLMAKQAGQYEPVTKDLDNDDFAPVAAPIINSGPKIGRNDPCPCGSGKKFKKCCGRH